MNSMLFKKFYSKILKIFMFPLSINRRKHSILEEKVEMVERKGVGHPDTICDSIVEEISVRLANYYLKEVGEILHYNIDKALLVAGEAINRFGGGEILKPMVFVIGDRATYFVDEKKLEIDELITRTVYEWFENNMRFVERKHIEVQNELKQGSLALRDIFKRKGKFMPANDTSALVGYAPLTKLEKIVLETEKFLNSKEFKKDFEETGEDVKVMGLRINNNFNMTIAIAFIDRFINSEEEYFRRKEEVKDRLLELTDYILLKI